MTKMKTTLHKLTASVTIAATLSLAIAGSSHTVFAGTDPVPASKDTVMEGVGEIFMKGTIDGKHVFLVVGADRAIQDTKRYLKRAIDIKKLKSDFKDLKHDINNPSHENDFADYVHIGAKFSQDTAPEILNEPWKTIEGIPEAYRVDFVNANTALHTTKNPTLGLIKYSGWAVWANVEGALKLVIEVPAEFAGITVATVAAVPFMATMQGLATIWEAGVLVVRQAADISVAAIEIAGEDAYSLVSASTASALTLIAAGAIATFKGGKWLVTGLPHQIKYPVSATVETKLTYDRQKEVAIIVRDFLKTWANQAGGTDVVADLGDYESTLTLMGTDAHGVRYAIGDIKVDTRDTISLKAELTRKEFKSRLTSSPNVSRKEMRSRLTAELNQILQEILQQIKTQPAEPAPAAPVLQ